MPAARPSSVLFTCVALSLSTVSTVALSEVAVTSAGFFAARAGHYAAPTGFLDGAGGILLDGDADKSRTVFGAESRIAIRAESGLEWTAELHLGARAEPRNGGDALGVVEAWVARRWFLENDRRIQLRFGSFFLPTSKENIDLLWVSPYTLTHSALNTWIGEEIRPIGIDLGHDQVLGGGRLELAATVFAGNDASGALLAWRGFALTDRLSLIGETLPLPPLQSLRDGIFSEQRDDGTQPFGRDLDQRAGAALRARYTGKSDWRASALLVDTAGDLQIYRGEYAWRTRFLLLGFDWHARTEEGWTFATEAMIGDSTMGPDQVFFVDIDFATAYALLSYRSDPWRFSARAERFIVQERDFSVGENNDQDGNALTIAGFYQINSWRLGAEWLYVDANRPGFPADGLPAQQGGHSLKIEARYQF